MQLNRRAISLLVFILLMAVFTIIIFHVVDVNDQKLKNNMGTSIGVISDVTSLRGSPNQVNYSFVINGKIIHNRESIIVDNTSLNYLRKVFVDKKLKLVYDTLEPSNSRLLLSVRDYNEFGLEPDSATLRIFKQIDSLRIGKDAIQQ
jgi:hypothetical protein